MLISNGKLLQHRRHYQMHFKIQGWLKPSTDLAILHCLSRATNWRANSSIQPWELCRLRVLSCVAGKDMVNLQQRNVSVARLWLLSLLLCFLQRNRTQTFVQVYLTSLLFVVVSWVSFLIKPDVVPGRMGLLVTIFLVLINIFNGVKQVAPVSSNLNAVDLYLVACITMVFAALVVYAIILFKNRERNKAKVEVAAIGNRHSEQTHSGSTVKIMTPVSNRPEKEALAYAYYDLDSASLIIFPIAFLIFNIVYSIQYSILSFS